MSNHPSEHRDPCHRFPSGADAVVEEARRLQEYTLATYGKMAACEAGRESPEEESLKAIAKATRVVSFEAKRLQDDQEQKRRYLIALMEEFDQLSKAMQRLFGLIDIGEDAQKDE